MELAFIHMNSRGPFNFGPSLLPVAGNRGDPLVHIAERLTAVDVPTGLTDSA